MMIEVFSARNTKFCVTYTNMVLVILNQMQFTTYKAIGIEHQTKSLRLIIYKRVYKIMSELTDSFFLSNYLNLVIL